MSRERRRDLAEISEVLKSALGEPATKDLAERIERELAARGFYGEVEAERSEPERCGGCGGLKQERDHERNSDKVCRCGGRKRRLLSYLDAADPERRMTLDALDASEPTVTAALEAACGIISGERRRGMLLMGLPGRGKCVAADEPIYLASGRRVLAKHLVDEEFELLTLIDGKPVRTAARAGWNAMEPTLAMTAANGRVAIRNGTHPFFVGRPGKRGLKDARPVGWTPLADVRAGDLVAVPMALPAFGRRRRLSDNEVKLLAYLIAEGGLTQSTPRFSQSPGPQLEEFRELVEGTRAVLVHHWGPNYRIVGTEQRKVIRPGTRSGYASVRVNRVAELLARHGLAGKHSRDKRAPEAVFVTTEEQTKLFLNRLFACDGWAFSRKGHKRRLGAVEVGFCSASPGLVQDVADLLLKLGFHAEMRAKPKANAFTLTLRDAVQVERFCREVGMFGKESATQRTAEIARHIHSHGAKRGAWRIASAPPGTRWEKVKSVQPAGVQATVAIEIPETGTFLTGFWEHNTHLLVGLGRALLAGDRDAGYYNVVRLVSRIQDTYSDFGGETRRAIVESVASHEVVLLDDLGKEHASTNVESIVYELFDALHVARVTLVAATNVPATRGEDYRGPTLSERYDEAVRSRLRAMCERFVVKGEDRRQAAWEW